MSGEEIVVVLLSTALIMLIIFGIIYKLCIKGKQPGSMGNAYGGYQNPAGMQQPGMQPGMMPNAPYGQQAPVRFCQKCGMQDMGGKNFCSHCGSPLPPVNQTNQYYPQQGQPMQKQNFFTRLWYGNRTAFIALFAVCTIIVGLAVGASVVKDEDNEYSGSGSSSSYYDSDSYGDYDSYDSYGDYDSYDSYGGYEDNSGYSDSYYGGYSSNTCSVCGGSGICQVCFGRGGLSYPTYGQGGDGWVECEGCHGDRTCQYCQ